MLLQKARKPITRSTKAYYRKHENWWQHYYKKHEKLLQKYFL